MMKKKNVLVMALSLVLVAVVAIGATLAYYSDTTAVVSNTFTADDSIDIDLNEHNYVQASNTLGTDKVKTNTYDDIYPNKTVPKDPFVTVSSVPSTGIKVYVRITGVDQYQSLNLSSNWVKITAEAGVNGIYEYNTTVTAAGDLPAVFTQVTFSDYTVAPADGFGNIQLYAYAVQATGLTGTDTTASLALAALNGISGNTSSFTLA